MTLVLRKKSDSELILDFKSLVAEERKTLTKILHHLREIEIRKLYLAKGYSSLFAFLTEEIGYSESAAQRRIQAMRLIKDIPVVEEKINKGKISLSVASQMQSFFKKEDQQRMKQKAPKLSSKEKLNLVDQLEETSARQCEQKLAEIAPESALPKEKTRPITEDKFLIQLSVDKKLMAKMEKLKGLLSHQNPEGSYEKLFETLVELGLDKFSPERREARRQKRPGKSKNMYDPLPTSAGERKHTRKISQPIRDKVWVRDKGRCGYRDPKTKKRCGSRHLLQIDHRYPFSLGGENDLENLRLRCSKHNQFHAAEAIELVLNQKTSKLSQPHPTPSQQKPYP